MNDKDVKKAIVSYYAKRGYKCASIRLCRDENKTGGSLVVRVTFDPSGPFGLNVVELRENAVTSILNGGKNGK